MNVKDQTKRTIWEVKNSLNSTDTRRSFSEM